MLNFEWEVLAEFDYYVNFTFENIDTTMGPFRKPYWGRGGGFLFSPMESVILN